MEFGELCVGEHMEIQGEWHVQRTCKLHTLSLILALWVCFICLFLNCILYNKPGFQYVKWLSSVCCSSKLIEPKKGVLETFNL